MSFSSSFQFSGHTQSVYRLFFDQKQYLFSGGGDKMLVQWDVLHPESPGIALLDAGEPIFSIWQNPETSVLWIGTSYGKVLVFDLMTRTLIQSFLFPGTGIFSITRLSGTLLVCTTGDGRWLCFHPQTHQFTEKRNGQKEKSAR